MASPNNYNNEYITFDQLMASIEDDLSVYADMGHIEADKYIRIAQQCNSFLSLKINPIKRVTLQVDNFRAKLPDDFKLWFKGALCSSYKEVQSPTTEVKTTTTTETDCTDCNEDTTTTITVTTESSVIIEVHEQVELFLKNTQYYCEGCYDSTMKNTIDVSISREGDSLYLNTGFSEGPVIIAYVSDMTTSDSIMIYDHPLVRSYYEYAIKERILEDLWLNGKEEVFNRYKLMVEKHRQAKIEAKRFVNTPDFREIKEMYKNKRKRHYYKYFAPLLYKAR